MPSKKQLTLKQAEAQMKANSDKYREYVKLQGDRKAAKTKKETDAIQKKMDALRSSYTNYRNAYRAFLAQGGSTRKPAAKKSGSKSTAKSNKGSQKKNGGPVSSKTLSKAAMSRRTKDNPDGLTDAQLAERDGPAVTPGSEVIRQG